MRDNKWESNENGGALWVDMADGTPVFVAEALGATVSVKAHRAAFIAKAVNEHDTLKAKAELFDELVEWFDEEDYKPFVLGQTTSELVNLVVTLTGKARGLK
jgi:hypothetical protein